MALDSKRYRNSDADRNTDFCEEDWWITLWVTENIIPNIQGFLRKNKSTIRFEELQITYKKVWELYKVTIPNGWYQASNWWVCIRVKTWDDFKTIISPWYDSVCRVESKTGKFWQNSKYPSPRDVEDTISEVKDNISDKL